MKLSDFILMNEKQKKNAVLHQGILLAKRLNSDCLVFLFQLDHYYVEVFCNRDNKEVEEFRMFDDTDPLQPYLETISIDALLN